MGHGVTVAELEALVGGEEPLVILDVRTPEEFAGGHHPRSKNAPAQTIAAAVAEIPPGAVVVCVCTKGGGRSQGAAATLRESGVDARFLEGGIKALGIAAAEH